MEGCVEMSTDGRMDEEVKRIFWNNTYMYPTDICFLCKQVNVA